MAYRTGLSITIPKSKYKGKEMPGNALKNPLKKSTEAEALMWANLHAILEFAYLVLDKYCLDLQWHFSIALLLGHQINIQFCKRRDFNNSMLKAII